MTTHKRLECAHCCDDYYFQASGWGAPEFNDSKYCPTCKEAIVTALNAIPKKYKYVWVATNDFTFKEACDIVAEDERILAEKQVLVRRVVLPLFKISTGETSVEHHFERNGVKYSLSCSQLPFSLEVICLYVKLLRCGLPSVTLNLLMVRHRCLLNWWKKTITAYNNCKPKFAQLRISYLCAIFKAVVVGWIILLLLTNCANYRLCSKRYFKSEPEKYNLRKKIKQKT